MDRRQRLFLAIAALLGVAATIYNWYLVSSEHRYYPKLAFFAPCGAILFAAASIVPGLTGPVSPGDTQKKYRQGALLLIGLAAGLLNWYFMSRS